MRYLLSRWLQNQVIHAFPLGTFVVNILGCLAIGLFYGLFERGNLMNVHLRMFLTVGLCGGFTTFSTFMSENFLLIKTENLFYLSLYAGLSLAGGLFMVYLGQWIIRLF